VDLNRNQFFFLGIMVLLIGLQFRLVSEYVLTDDATKFLAQRVQATQSDRSLATFASDFGVLPRKVIRPPEWLGWCLISVGAVIVLQSLAMKRPD